MGKIIEDRASALDGRFTVGDPVFLPDGFRKVNLLELPANTREEDTTKQSR